MMDIKTRKFENKDITTLDPYPYDCHRLQISCEGLVVSCAPLAQAWHMMDFPRDCVSEGDS